MRRTKRRAPGDVEHQVGPVDHDLREKRPEAGSVVEHQRPQALGVATVRVADDRGRLVRERVAGREH